MAGRAGSQTKADHVEGDRVMLKRLAALADHYRHGLALYIDNCAEALESVRDFSCTITL